MSAQESLTLLHLSDPQFGRNHRFGGLGLDTLFERLGEDLCVLEKERVHPEVFVVYGDLAEWGKKKEFQQALEFLTRLTERLKLPSRRRVVIVPGNHDINRKLCESYFKQCEGEEQPPAAPYWTKWTFYHWLFQEFY